MRLLSVSPGHSGYQQEKESVSARETTLSKAAREETSRSITIIVTGTNGSSNRIFENTTYISTNFKVSALLIVHNQGSFVYRSLISSNTQLMILKNVDDQYCVSPQNW